MMWWQSSLLTANMWVVLIMNVNSSSVARNPMTGTHIQTLPTINLFNAVYSLTDVKSRQESGLEIFAQSLPGLLLSWKRRVSDTFNWLIRGPFGRSLNGNSEDMDLLYYSIGRVGRWSQRDLWLAMGMSLISLILLTYFVYVLYRTCCSRNYVEWRTSWSLFFKATAKRLQRLGRKGCESRSGFSSQSQFDAIPVKLTGDAEEIDCISTCLDSPFVATVDLQGDLTVWDALSGECHTLVRRSLSNMHFHHQLANINSVQQQRQMLSRLNLHLQTTSTSQQQPHQAMAGFRANSIAIPSSMTPSSFQACHRPSGSFSSDSTFGSSETFSASFVNLSSVTPDPPVISTSLMNTSSSSHTPVSSLLSPQASSSRTGNQHRRHHSMSSISKLQSSLTSCSSSSIQPESTSTASPSMRTSSQIRNNSHHHQRPFDFSPFAQKLNSSRELLTDLIRSAVASGCASSSSQGVAPANATVDSPLNFKAIWTMELFGRYVYLGCQNGRVEVWDALTGSLAYFHEKSSNGVQGLSPSASFDSSDLSVMERNSKETSGVTAIKVNNTRMIVSYLDGMMETYHLEPKRAVPSSELTSGSSSMTSRAYRSTAALVTNSTSLSSGCVVSDTASSSAVDSFTTCDFSCRPPLASEGIESTTNASYPRSETTSSPFANVSESRCSADIAFSSQLFYSLFHVVRAHRQPITVMELTTSQIITGSLDHTVKVHSLSQEGRSTTSSCLYTLHAHCGGITCIELDPSSPSTAISGCQVGQVCVWDLQTGTCLFSLEAHPGSSVSAILVTPLYIVSSGTDDKMFIWDKNSGKLVHSIHQVCVSTWFSTVHSLQWFSNNLTFPFRSFLSYDVSSFHLLVRCDNQLSCKGWHDVNYTMRDNCVLPEKCKGV